ncbi:hypothetical protein QA640_15685 [Bradyrhizobium sp. CB82]|uniref:hypothetical protein n=1 Tax=Bradyrhizobium sp. CB82 TaxID=3039159 RepID=UPI0024B1BFB2|nr:hypothetical protein [Bradyrhizobium sp. CB82]WFU43750.1 hypothetical protein QA640_15685 [Bradyrhizobium sp. CB82]
MTNPLLARAQRALEENASVRELRRLLLRQCSDEREQLRIAVFESAMSRSEVKAYRDDAHGVRSEPR